MAEASRERVRRARLTVPEALLSGKAVATPKPPALSLNEFDLIAELKLRSPASGGLVDHGFDRRAQIEAYARGGAAAVSVLTEPDEFNGDLSHLREAAAHLAPFGCPAMRKDFLTDPYQVLEARASGAGGVLIIVTMLSDAALSELIATAAELDLFVLLETFDRADLARLAAVRLPEQHAGIIAGVNCRDLRTLEVDVDRFERLARDLPTSMPTVAESGIGNADDIRSVARLGYRLALVGSALMQSEDTEAAVAQLIDAGRASAAEARTCS